MATPTPVFPAAVATDAQLKVANNLISTTLSVGVDGVNTILFVASAAGFVANGLVSVENEIMSIASVVTTPNPQLIVATGGRGFDGTVAVPHSAGVKVSMFIDAWHHNVLATEVKAIEAFIGPNGQNIGGSSAYYLMSSAYKFAPQSPGGSLITGNNSITLSPVPAGVNASDANHYLYISGGTGSAEAVLITGGTAVSGAPSGTIIVSCANTHSGAWTIQSATAGIQEAVNSLSGPINIVQIPAGTWNVQGSITVGGNNVKIRGEGRRATTLQRDVTVAAFDVFTLFNSSSGSSNEVSGLSISLSAAATSNYGINAQNQSEMLLADMNIQTPNGLRIVGDGYSIIRDIMIPEVAANQNGMLIAGGLDVKFQNIFMGVANTSSPGFAAINLQGGGVWFFDTIDAIQFTKGVFAQPTSIATEFLSFKTVFMDTCADTAWTFAPGSGGSIISVICEDCWAATAVNQGLVLDSTTGPVYGVKWLGGRIYDNGQHGIQLIGANTFDTVIADSTIGSNGRTTANRNEIDIGVGVTKVTIANNVIGAADAPPGFGWNPTATYGLMIHAGASDYIQVTGNRFTGGYVTGAVSDASTGSHVTISNNLGYNPVGTFFVSVGASPFTYTAGHAPENIYIFGGTVSSIVLNSVQVAAASPATIALSPNQSVTVTYSVAPTIMKDIH